MSVGSWAQASLEGVAEEAQKHPAVRAAQAGPAGGPRQQAWAALWEMQWGHYRSHQAKEQSWWLWEQQGGDPGLRGGGKEMRLLTSKCKHFLCAGQALCPLYETPELTKLHPLLPQDVYISHTQDPEVAERASRPVFSLSLGAKRWRG